MSGLRLEISAPDGSSSPSALLVEACGVSALGLLYPVARPSGPTPIEGEALLPEVAATVHFGTPLTMALAAELDRGAPSVTSWCVVATPWPIAGRIRRQPYLRIGTATSLTPLLVLQASARALCFDFIASGAPIARAPSRDHGGPIDQSFVESVEIARRELGEWLTRLAATSCTFRLSNRGLEPTAALGLADALGNVPSLTLDL